MGKNSHLIFSLSLNIPVPYCARTVSTNEFNNNNKSSLVYVRDVLFYHVYYVNNLKNYEVINQICFFLQFKIFKTALKHHVTNAASIRLIFFYKVNLNLNNLEQMSASLNKKA